IPARLPLNPTLQPCNGPDSAIHASDLQEPHMTRITGTILIGLLMAVLRPARLGAQQHADDPLLLWMNGIAQQQLQQREDAIAAIHTVAEADARKLEVREKLLKLLGGLPDYTGPLNAKVTSHIQAAGYVIEKVIFESLP